MASLYSTNLKLELIGTGDQSGLWGGTTNTNLGTALEQAIVGKASLVTGDFTANVATLTLLDANASQTARAFVLDVTATLSAAGTLNVPAIQKPYLVFNNTVGGFALTVKVSGLTGVVVPNGKRMLVYNNGTDVIDGINYLNGVATTAGTATNIAGGVANNIPYQLGAGSTSYITAPVTPGHVLVWDGTAFTWAGIIPNAAGVEYDPPFAGALTTGYTVEDKLSQTVSVKDFGAVGDGVTDDTAAIQAAIDSLGAAGGVVCVIGQYRIGANLTVKPNVFLAGNFKMPGRSTVGSGAATDYSVVGSGSLRVASTATITLQGGAGLDGLLIYRHGMVFPATTSSTAAGFAGTAVTVTGDDASVRACMIMGFNKALYSSGPARLRVDYLYHDNINGIEITNCNDVPYLTNCHAWPFATIVAGQTWPNLIRSGTAYYIHDFVDWARLTNCFSYGYAIGFKVSDANSTILTACGADNVYDGAPLHAGSIGYVVQQTCYETKLIGCQAAAQATAGVFVNVANGLSTFINEQTIWGCGSNGVLVQNGDAIVSGGAVRNTSNGVSVDDTASKVVIRGTTFADISGKPVNVIVANTGVQVSGCNFTNYSAAPVGGTAGLVAPSVASAAAVLLPNNGDVFTITGTTSFGTLQHGWAGREVTLIFTGALTVFNGTGSPTNMKLLGGASLNTGSDTVLVLKHNGVQWYEVGRS